MHTSTQSVYKAINALSKTEVMNNDWGRSYIKNRKQDIGRYAQDIDIVCEYLNRQSVICDHASAPFVLPYAMSLMGFQMTATDLKPERFGDNNFPFKCIKYDVENSGEPIGYEVYDGVIFNEIFEHCRIDLISTIDNIKKA